ncbi:DUF1294 domain-containing protein [Facklamia sp. DSM 111018]|uniref:DUF1294 domain-containing protein n=1 Tax=Facklamia lactis TaxID=2749967 RepID=A0ABS0LMQ2_9LACT|nr:DUF1294 domain-containing protein [Facklamia lactis]MBG9979877.1 DUF1294 domain-containing protein [Facklamia lactis]MBG9985443.1 DUF1294 domain-containing protein [Facklamia lactis]
MNHFLLIALGLWNFIVFLNYGYDKRQAKLQAWRLSEKHLLTITLLFGGIGAFFAIQFFRHKTQKSIFLASSLFSILITVVLIGVIYSK